jgi:hypothetical protein
MVAGSGVGHNCSVKITRHLIDVTVYVAVEMIISYVRC